MFFFCNEAKNIDLCGGTVGSYLLCSTLTFHNDTWAMADAVIKSVISTCCLCV